MLYKMLPKLQAVVTDYKSGEAREQNPVDSKLLITYSDSHSSNYLLP